MPRGLSIHGRLALTLEGHRIVIEGDGDHVVVDVPNRGALWVLIQHRPVLGKSPKPDGGNRRTSGGSDARTVEVIADLLGRADLTVTVTLAGKTVARAGVNAQPTWLSKLMGLGPIEVHPTSAILALWKG